MHCFGQSSRTYSTRGIQKRNADFERMRHAHGVGIAQKSIHQIGAQLQPGDRVKASIESDLRGARQRQPLSTSVLLPRIGVLAQHCDDGCWGEERAGEKIRVRRASRSSQRRRFAKSVSASRETHSTSAAQLAREGRAQRRGQPARAMFRMRATGGRAERSVAAEKFVAAEAGERDFQPACARPRKQNKC